MLFFRENDRFDFYAVADGVSSCVNSKKGAEIACSVACDVMINEFDYYIDSPVRKAAWLITRHIQTKLSEYADRSTQKVETFASTLCFICIDKNSGRAFSFTLGDSHLYILNSGKICLAKETKLYRNNMICATVTESAEEAAIINSYNKEEYDGFVLCTDGVWKSLFTQNASYNFWSIEECKKMIEEFKIKKTQDDATVLFVA